MSLFKISIFDSQWRVLIFEFKLIIVMNGWNMILSSLSLVLGCGVGTFGLGFLKSKLNGHLDNC